MKMDKRPRLTIREKILRYSIPEPNSGCWIWERSASRGYGRISMGDGTSKFYSAHKASYIEFKGKITPGAIIRHTCDNTFCVNPDHLIEGSQKDNMQDWIKRKFLLEGKP